MTNIEQLVWKLEAIAKLNDDEFRYRIDLNLSRGRTKLGFGFVCEEAAEGHTFLESHGLTIEAAILDAVASIKSAVEDWGYEMPQT